MAPVTPKNRATRSRRKRQDTNRRWCIPPAILRDPDETLEGIHVLEELPGDLGLLLWRALRDVTLWAAVQPERRAALFRPGAAERRLLLLAEVEAPGTLELSLATLAAVSGDAAGARPEAVSLACTRVARWAEESRLRGTAVAFAQAAALAVAHRASPAFDVGRLALAWGRTARAETWFRRAVGLARRSDEWDAYARAYVGMGTLMAGRGAHEAARRYYVKGMRAARRHGLLDIRALALHGILRLALRTGALDEAERLARAAARAYGRDHPQRGELLQDLAALWIERGRHARAASVLQKLLAGRRAAEDRVAGLALLARAAAGAGNLRLYEDAWGAAWALATAVPPSEHPGALLDLAQAAAERGDWLRVDQATRLVCAVVRHPVEKELVERLAAAAAAARVSRGG
jgi:tetratricopeptide (TPR) repeat protein